MPSRWDERAPSEDEPLDLVVYRSRLIGSDTSLVVWGGGNTSVKTVERDHLGRERQVLRIKGSGTDLKSIDRSGFPGIFIDEILPLLDRESMSDEGMVAYLEHCLVEPGGRRPSIETLLHGFLPARHVDHTHADAIICLTNTERGEEAVRDALGDRIAYVPWKRPGFELSKLVHSLADYDAVVLGNHGLVTWGDTARESYEATIDLVDRAEAWLQRKAESRGIPASQGDTGAPDLIPLLLHLRRRLGYRILNVWKDNEFRTIADRPDVDELANAGPATADHVLRIRPWACVLRDIDPAPAIDAYEQKYRAWFEAHAAEDMQMLDPLPRVFLVPGLGAITAGRTEREARIAAEVAIHTLQIAARGKDAHGSYRSLSDRDLFDVEYWPLELYKLTLAPAPRELEGRIIAVTGAASGIGRAVARHLAALGGQLALLDLDRDGLEVTAQAIARESGTSARCLAIDLTDDAAVRDAVWCIVETYGGIDALVSNAGIGAGGKIVDLTADLWRKSMEVNATSHFLITAQVMAVMEEQGMGGSMVYVASKNAFGPGAGFGAYSAAKAAQVQIARIAALEGGPKGIRSNVVNPDAVFEDSKLWTETIRKERAAAHGVPVEEIEQFYANRSLLKRIVTGRDVAEAVAYLVSDRSRATTGTVITVDSGVPAAFPR